MKNGSNSQKVKSIAENSMRNKQLIKAAVPLEEDNTLINENAKEKGHGSKSNKQKKNK